MSSPSRLLTTLAAGATAVAVASPVVPSAAGIPPGHLAVYTTSAAGQRLALTATPSLEPATQPPESDVAIVVDTRHAHHAFLGIGGAITDATAEVFARLPPERQDELLRAYFDPVEGLGYTLLRTTIHSSDFSPASYTYVEEGDAALRSFSIAHDRAARLPMIHRAMTAAGGGLVVYASPWSAPAFMKTNGSLLRGGRLKPEFADAWAHYLARFVKAYRAEGVPIWALTVQNEPMATQRWESMLYTAEEERDFLRDHLGPVLAREGLGDVKLIVWDHNRDLMVHRAHAIFDDPEASKYAWGLGFHWYETWAGGEPMHDNVAAVRAAYPDKHLLLTEATVERFDPARLQDWANAERYATQILRDLARGAEGWTDWNLLLDEQGGPNHVGNFCFAPVHADTATGILTYTPSFWVLGHFSRWLRPGARFVDASSTRSALLTVAGVNPGGRTVVVVVNRGDVAVDYRLQVDGREARIAIPAHAVQTVVAA